MSPRRVHCMYAHVHTKNGSILGAKLECKTRSYSSPFLGILAIQRHAIGYRHLRSHSEWRCSSSWLTVMVESDPTPEQHRQTDWTASDCCRPAPLSVRATDVPEKDAGMEMTASLTSMIQVLLDSLNTKAIPEQGKWGEYDLRIVWRA